MSALPRKLYLTGIVALLFAGLSAWYLLAAIAPCQNLTALTIFATLSAFLISVCLRQMGRHPVRHIRLYLLGCLVVAAITLVVDFHYVRSRHAECGTPQWMQQSILPGRSQ
jgi:multidrug transporter EmrE-like cation transporter